MLHSNLALSVRKDKGLSHSRLRRLLDCTDIPSAQKILLECGFADNELNALINYFAEICPDEIATSCFLSEYLFHNAKVFYKSRVFELKKIEAALFDYGRNIGEEIAEKRYDSLPIILGETLQKLDENQNISPQLIDIEIDKARFNQIKLWLEKTKNKQVKSYFYALMDLVNIGIIYRAKKLGLEFPHNMLTQTTVLQLDLNTLYESKTEELIAAFIDTPYQKIMESIEDNQLFEREKDEYLAAIFAENIDDYFKIDGIFYYYVTKVNELKAVKMILSFIGGKMDKSIAKKRLGVDYD